MPRPASATETEAIFDEPLAYSEDEKRTSFEAEDDRWSRQARWRDWLILSVMIAVSLSYHFTIFALQPGLR